MRELKSLLTELEDFIFDNENQFITDLLPGLDGEITSIYFNSSSLKYVFINPYGVHITDCLDLDKVLDWISKIKRF